MIQVRNFIVLLVVFLYMLLNYGFMQVRVPPVDGAGVPIGEFVLIISLLTIRYSVFLPRLSSVVYLVPFIIWWIYGLIRAFSAVPDYGMWALRDASHVIESLFLILGFAVVARQKQLDRFFLWLSYILFIVCVYALGFPIMSVLQELSPKIIAGSGKDVSLFFNYTNTSALLIMAGAYLVIFNSGKSRQPNLYFILAVFLIGYAVIQFQARTIYLQLIGLFILFSLYKRSLLSKGVIGAFVFIIVLSIIPFTGLELSGRLGQAVSIEFFVNHFMAIGGIESDGLEGAAGGVGQRIEWWLGLYEQWISSIKKFLFGLGYGFPLIDFGIADGVMVREPHNSYISILARGGLFAAVMWLWMHLILLKIWRKLYLYFKNIGNTEYQNRLLILMVYFVLVWIFAIGEDAFEKPFIMIPYYFFWGVILRIGYNQKMLVKYI